MLAMYVAGDTPYFDFATFGGDLSTSGNTSAMADCPITMKLPNKCDGYTEGI